MDRIEVAIRSARLIANIRCRTTPGLDGAGVVTRDLCRYYALLERERPSIALTSGQARLIADALPLLGTPRPHEEGRRTQAEAVEEHARRSDAGADGVDVAELTAWLRGLRLAEALTVLDAAELATIAEARKDPDARDRARREFGISA